MTHQEGCIVSGLNYTEEALLTAEAPRRGLLNRQQPGHMCVQRHRGCWELRWLLTWTFTTYGGKGLSDIYIQDWGERSEHRALAVSIEGGQRSLEECLGTTLPLLTIGSGPLDGMVLSVKPHSQFSSICHHFFSVFG